MAPAKRRAAASKPASKPYTRTTRNTRSASKEPAPTAPATRRSTRATSNEPLISYDDPEKALGRSRKRSRRTPEVEPVVQTDLAIQSSPPHIVQETLEELTVEVTRVTNTDVVLGRDEDIEVQDVEVAASDVEEAQYELPQIVSDDGAMQLDLAVIEEEPASADSSSSPLPQPALEAPAERWYPHSILSPIAEVSDEDVDQGYSQHLHMLDGLLGRTESERWAYISILLAGPLSKQDIKLETDMFRDHFVRKEELAKLQPLHSEFRDNTTIATPKSRLSLSSIFYSGAKKILGTLSLSPRKSAIQTVLGLPDIKSQQIPELEAPANEAEPFSSPLISNPPSTPAASRPILTPKSRLSKSTPKAQANPRTPAAMTPAEPKSETFTKTPRTIYWSVRNIKNQRENWMAYLERQQEREEGLLPQKPTPEEKAWDDKVVEMQKAYEEWRNRNGRQQRAEKFAATPKTSGRKRAASGSAEGATGEPLSSPSKRARTATSPTKASSPTKAFSPTKASAINSSPPVATQSKTGKDMRSPAARSPARSPSKVAKPVSKPVNPPNWIGIPDDFYDQSSSDESDEDDEEIGIVPSLKPAPMPAPQPVANPNPFINRYAPKKASQLREVTNVASSSPASASAATPKAPLIASAPAAPSATPAVPVNVDTPPASPPNELLELMRECWGPEMEREDRFWKSFPFNLDEVPLESTLSFHY